MTPETEFQKLLKEVVERLKPVYKTQAELAAAIPIDQTRFSKALRKGDYPFDIENCLRFARATGEPASKVLRAAKHAVLVDLIEELYGPEKPIVDPATKDLLEKWKNLEADERLVVMTTINHFVAKRSEEHPGAQKSDAAEEPRRKSTARPRRITGLDRSPQRPRPRKGKPPA